MKNWVQLEQGGKKDHSEKRQDGGWWGTEAADGGAEAEALPGMSKSGVMPRNPCLRNHSQVILITTSSADPSSAEGLMTLLMSVSQ